MTETIQDQWAQWLLQRRHGGDPEHQQSMLQELFGIRDQILQHASLAEGEILLDVKAGFEEVHLDLQVNITPKKPQGWEGFWRSSPNPLAPTLEEVMQEALTPAEAERFTAHLQPLVEQGQGTDRMALAYLWAKK
jgi:hypothetical protein